MKFTKNHKKSPINLSDSPKIKPIEAFNHAVFNYMNQLNGGENKKTPNIEDFIENNHQNFKKLSLENQLKILFYYIKVNSKNGLFKRPSLAHMGKYFGGVDKNTISKRLVILEEKQYIRHANDIDLKQVKNIYKILKNEY